MVKRTRTPAPSRRAAPGGAKVERLQKGGFLRKGKAGGPFRYATAT